MNLHCSLITEDEIVSFFTASVYFLIFVNAAPSLGVAAVHDSSDFLRRRFVVRVACCSFFRGVFVIRNDVPLSRFLFALPTFAQCFRRDFLGVLPGLFPFAIPTIAFFQTRGFSKFLTIGISDL